MSQNKTKTPRPPRMAAWLVDRLFPDGKTRIPNGDFEEVFYEISQKRGPGIAKLWYWAQFILSLKSILISRFYWNGVMLKNYLKTSIRHIVSSQPCLPIRSGITMPEPATC